MTYQIADLQQYLQSETELRWIVGKTIKTYMSSPEFKNTILDIIQDRNLGMPTDIIESVVSEARYVEKVESEIFNYLPQVW